MNAPEKIGSMIVHDTPSPSTPGEEIWGSDAIASMLQELDIPYLAINPGASYRGLHDSLVNYTGNVKPQMLLCLHEESAVSIAQGYAKASGKMMGAVLHSNVGLMHASMSIFNAWCDRIPMLLLGATGPWDANKRRPWIDWIHTASDQGALVRDYTKWDNQPASIPATFEALLRAVQIADTAPRGPTYVNLDSAMQEAKLGKALPIPKASRFGAPPPTLPSHAQLNEAAKLLSGAKNPVILMGRTSRNESDWKNRIELAEKLQAVVLTDTKMPAAFPSTHKLHPFISASSLSQAACEYIRTADVILSLDWYDLAGTLKQGWEGGEITAKIINVSPDQLVHRGWSMDYQGLPPMDIYMMCEADPVVPLLTGAIATRPKSNPPARPVLPPADRSAVSIRTLADAVNAETEGMDVCFVGLPIGWNSAYRNFDHPMDYLGSNGGGGIGAGPGISIGAALALKGSGRLPIGILGDGDFLMGNTALWTAVHYQIPCLLLISNNRSFYNDEVHQERVAKTRDRPVENKWIGQQINEPDIDLAMMARSQGAVGIGPVKEVDDLREAIRQGIEAVKAGKTCVVDVRVLPGYDVNVTKSKTSQAR